MTRKRHTWCCSPSGLDSTQIDAVSASANGSLWNDRSEAYGFGGEHYLRTGETISSAAVEELRGADAILLGAIGHPDVKPGILEQGILLRLRFELDQYVNLRPVKLYPGVPTPIAGLTFLLD